jgi:hypothetical protein
MKAPWTPAPATLAAVILPALLGCPAAAPPAPPPQATPAPIQTRQTIRKTTQNVMELAEAVKQGGVPAETSITGQGMGMAAEAFRTTNGKMAVMAVEKTMQLYQAEHDRKPKDYAEFMARIIQPGKPDGLQLPMLPYYQEYAYDPENHQVIVMEFPAKKEQRQKETTGPSGL